MPLPLIPIAFAALAGLALAKKQAEADTAAATGVMTPARQVILDTALANETDPAKLRALADAFRAQGLTAEANLLSQRADLRDAPPEVKDQRRQIFRAGMASQDPIAVTGLAEAFGQVGATGAAFTLNKYAADLKVGQMAVAKVAAPPSTSPLTPKFRTAGRAFEPPEVVASATVPQAVADIVNAHEAAVRAAPTPPAGPLTPKFRTAGRGFTS